ncbi:MAG: glycosyltransferase family 4 protein [Pyrinomonadaceae bacterium]
MAPLHIILVMIEPPLPFGNAAARWYYVLLKGLVQRGHRVTAFAACGNPDDIDQAAKLFPAPGYDLRCFAFPERQGLRAKWQTLRQPFSYVFSDELRTAVKAELAADFDVLHLEMMWSGWLGLDHTKRALLNLHYLYEIDWQDAPNLTAGERRRRRHLLRAERSLLRRYPYVRTLTPRLTKRVQELHPSVLAETVPLGLDALLYEFRPAGRPAAVPTVGLVGSFNWGPTHSAGMRLVNRLWPEIKRQVPAARLLIVGREARTALKEFVDRPDVEINENVPDIAPHLRCMNVMLYAPGRGSGMKVKVLESMALGIPVVTTSEGVEGLSAVDGVQTGISDDDAGLIERTVALLNDPERAAQQSKAARTLIETDCDPDAALDAIERMYQRINTE